MFEDLFNEDKKKKAGQATPAKTGMFADLFSDRQESSTSRLPVQMQANIKASGTMSQPAPEKEKKWLFGTDWIRKSIKSAYNTTSDTVKNAANALGELVDRLDSSGVKLSDYQKAPTGSYEERQKYLDSIKKVTPLERATKAGQALVSAGNFFFLPYTVPIEAGKELPGPLSWPSKAVSAVFGKAGEIGSYVSDKGVNVLPMSDENKEVVRPLFQELGAFAAQVAGIKALHATAKGAGGKAVEKLPISKNAKEKLSTGVQTGVAYGMNPFQTTFNIANRMVLTKMAERQQKGVEITPEETKAIVDEVKSELPKQIGAEAKVEKIEKQKELPLPEETKRMAQENMQPEPAPDTRSITEKIDEISTKLEESIKGYQTYGGETAGKETPNAYLRDIDQYINTQEGKKLARENISKAVSKGEIEIGEDGKITLYRVGKTSKLNDLFSATSDRKVAEMFSASQPSKPKIVTIKVDPEQVKYVIGGPEKEVLLGKKAKEPKSKENNNLLAEAKKYKTAEEFVNSQKVFRGETIKGTIRNVNGKIKGKTEFGDAPFVSFADNPKLASRFGDRLDEHFIDKSRILDLENSTDKKALDIIKNDIDPSQKQVKELKKLGYDGISFNNFEDKSAKVSGKEIRYFGDFDLGKTKSQLTDIWEKANKEPGYKSDKAIPGVKSEDIISVKRFGSSVEGKTKPNDYDHFVIVKDGSMKFKNDGGLPKPIIKTVGKNQYFIMPESAGEDLLNAMLYTGRKDASRQYSGKTVDVTNDFKGGSENPPPPVRSGKTPGEGSDGKMQSRVFQRLQQEHPEALEGDLTYNAIKLKEDAKKAVDLINKDPEKAMRVAMSMEELPGQTSTAVNIAMAEKALESKNYALYSQLVKSRSLTQTRRGQEIVAEKGSVENNDTSKYVKQLVKTRLDVLGSKLGNILDSLKPVKKGYTKKAVEKIDKETKKVQEQIKNKELDIKEAQKIIDALTCK